GRRGFVDIVFAIRFDAADRADGSIAPGDFERHVRTAARSEHAKRIGAGLIITTANDFGALHQHDAIEQLDLRTDGLRIRRDALHADDDSQRTGFVAINFRRTTHHVHREIEIATVLEIADSDAAADGGIGETPFRSVLAKLQTAEV